MARFEGVAFGFVMVAMLRCAAAQTIHVVGDGLGWTVPQGGATVYSNWANGKTFAVGDILTFNFRSNEHDVLRVQKSSFDACTSTNAIGDAINTGPTNITLTSAGEHYYICTIGRHCQSGQKLAITVSSGTPGSMPPSTTPAPPTTITPTTPSPSSGITPADCIPTPSPSPTITPPGSGATHVLASTLLSTLALTIGLLL